MWYWIVFGTISIVVSVVIFKIYVILTTGWCRSQTCLVGKTVIVTGANSGIGYEAALDFAKRGARVILACRSENKAIDAVRKITRETGNNNVCYKILDLSSFLSVRGFVEDVLQSEPRLNILVNNAGCQGVRKTTEDGLDFVMQSNYFGHFLLSNLLMDLIKRSAPSRILNVSSDSARFPTLKRNAENLTDSTFFNFFTYARSKQCMLLFSTELHQQLRGTGVTSYAVQPGMVYTDLLKYTEEGLWKVILKGYFKFFKNNVEGAQTTIYCAVQKDIEELSGEFFQDCSHRKKYYFADNPDLAKKLWEKTTNIVGLNKHDTRF